MASTGGESLSRNKSVTEPWITSPRKEATITVESTNESKDNTTNARIIANVTTESTNETSNEEKTFKSPKDTNGNVKTVNNDENKQTTEPEVHSQKNGNDQDNSFAEEKNNETKPTLVGNVIENKSVSGKSNDVSKTNSIADLEPVNDDDLDMYDPDLLITEEEKKAFEYMIEQKRGELQKDKAKFDKWVDSITRRRMFALSRLRKLGKCHGERFKFYGKVQDYVKEVESVLSSASSTTSVHSENNKSTPNSSKPPSASPNKNKSNPNSSKSPSASSTNSKQTNSKEPKTNGFSRETTGFVNVPKNDKNSDSIGDKVGNQNHTFNDETPTIVPVQS
ncbi:uncharacterized G-patch domain protein DDB_G0278987-like [Argopecten irradians]|uniref:uncharacterized G-patch domain protein DDB_G0278987-like n=1 Tax=Argopecten irradians TaxID=31199 RepID=UPI0037135B60